jgi:hypothetical protein
MVGTFTAEIAFGRYSYGTYSDPANQQLYKTLQPSPDYALSPIYYDFDTSFFWKQGVPGAPTVVGTGYATSSPPLPTNALFVLKAITPAVLANNQLLLGDSTGYFTAYIFNLTVEVDIFVGPTGNSGIIPTAAATEVAIAVTKVDNFWRVGYLNAGALTWVIAAFPVDPPTVGTLNIGRAPGWVDWGNTIHEIKILDGTFSDAEILAILQA